MIPVGRIECVVADISAKKLILCVEDQPETSELIAAILVEYEVESVDNIQAARSMLATQKFSLIVLDYNLPDGDGLSFCREIRRVGLQTPVIFITGDPTITEAIVQNSGGQRLIEKDSLTFIDELISESDSLSITVA